MKVRSLVTKENLLAITEEFNSLDNLIKLDDWRSDDWYLAPLKLEDEDAGVFAQDDIDNFKRQSPITTQLITDMGAIAASFGSLNAHSVIEPHTHDNPFITHVLTLQAHDCCIVVEDELIQLNAGELISFDYRPMHAVYNDGDIAWTWLMVLLPMQ